MFVTRSKYREAQQQTLEASMLGLRWRAEYATLLERWNSLAKEFKEGKWVRPGHIGNSTFTQEEIETLVNLCHPDKHNGSERANKMTARLLQLRKKP